MSTDQTPDEGIGKRGRGRPKIGPAIPVRLYEQEQRYITELGEGVAAKGARSAINIAMRTGGFDKLPPDAIQSLLEIGEGDLGRAVDHLLKSFESNKGFRDAGAYKLTQEEIDTAKLIGNGSASKGIKAALSVAVTMGPEAIRRIANHGPDTQNSI